MDDEQRSSVEDSCLRRPVNTVNKVPSLLAKCHTLMQMDFSLLISFPPFVGSQLDHEGGTMIFISLELR
jgi:hypothetical protein